MSKFQLTLDTVLRCLIEMFQKHLLNDILQNLQLYDKI
jgi:hypothetical protein